MPLFDFRCPVCGAVKEVLVQRCTDRVLCHNHRVDTAYPEPMTEPYQPFYMERLISAPARPANSEAVHNRREFRGIRTQLKGESWTNGE